MPGGQLGYSLLELVASILLIAAIAVLSLPTYQDFTPHSELSDERSRESSLRGEKTASSPPAKGEFQDQPVDRPVSKKENGEEQEQRENARR